jgi:16S rRNA (guanine966-N2)-methyltransferase
VRVISGTAKGRTLKAVPGNGTRPTTDKVKEAIFSMIGPYFDGGAVLDLFAGTGALGIEALSRGMERAVFVDGDKRSIEIVAHNLKVTRLEELAEVYRNDALRALKAMAKRDVRFRLVFLDPPYKLRTIETLISTLHTLNLLESEATIVVEHEADYECEERIGRAVRIRRVNYGDTAVSIYSFQEGEDANESTQA